MRVAGLTLTSLYVAVIGWIYVQQPASVAELTGGLAASVGAYSADPAAFAEGLARFRTDRFVEARAAWQRADPARRDALTQFYVAYSYYREGWGRLHGDDVLFAAGLEAVERAASLAPGGRLTVSDPDLRMRSIAELQAELAHGLRVEPDDFNPLRILRERK